MSWTQRRLAQHVDEQRIRTAIASAERHTSGVIHVTLAPHFWGELHRGAARAFRRLQAASGPHRNGVLFFVVPSRRELAVLGDAAIHERVGQAYWDRLAALTAAKIKSEGLTAGLVDGIEQAGAELARHFPSSASS